MTKTTKLLAIIISIVITVLSFPVINASAQGVTYSANDVAGKKGETVTVTAGNIACDESGKAYYKIETNGHIDQDALVDYIHKTGIGVSKGTIQAVLTQLGITTAHLLGIGYNVNIAI